MLDRIKPGVRLPRKALNIGYTVYVVSMNWNTDMFELNKTFIEAIEFLNDKYETVKYTTETMDRFLLNGAHGNYVTYGHIKTRLFTSERKATNYLHDLNYKLLEDRAHRERIRKFQEQFKPNLEAANDKYVGKKIYIWKKPYGSDTNQWVLEEVRRVDNVEGTHELIFIVNYDKYLESREGKNWKWYSELEELEDKKLKLLEQVRALEEKQKKLKGELII